jgi:hypothetical protein
MDEIKLLHHVVDRFERDGRPGSRRYWPVAARAVSQRNR